MKALAQAHIQELDAKLQELQAMKATLAHLVHCCHGDDRPDCPIIENLAGEHTQTLPAEAAIPRKRSQGLGSSSNSSGKRSMTTLAPV